MTRNRNITSEYNLIHTKNELKTQLILMRIEKLTGGEAFFKNINPNYKSVLYIIKKKPLARYTGT